MRNVEELRNEMSAIFQELRDRKITPKEADSFSTIVGKITQSAKVQLEYYALRKEAPNIDFLNAGKPKAAAKR